MGYYEPLTYIVPTEDDGMLLKTILAKRMELSRKLLSRLKQTEQGITLNGERVYISVRVSSGDRVEIRMEEEQSDDILPEELPVHILFEDDHLLVVNKPVGQVVHPTHGHYTGTLANAVVFHWQQQGLKVRFRPIHRLDQDTSGTLAIAKNPYIHQNISEQMQAGEVDKEYTAFVHGIMEPLSGTVRGPIDRDPERPHIRIVTPDGYPSVTHYAVERAYSQTVSRVRLKLETGRTHQIRVHMRHIGHPLLGDAMYGLNTLLGYDDYDHHTYDPRWDDRINRHALHASMLSFQHPFTKERMVFNAPLPDDLSELEAALNHPQS
ncbi:MAG: yjbO [Paenibacillus sp.]|jgi:23S rRNA pseudouridine1911/1915/1917 synthase|nr:yjbO [Paenibacillus sp.]